MNPRRILAFSGWLDPETAAPALIEAINARRAADDQKPLARSEILTRAAQEAAEKLAPNPVKALPNQGRDLFANVRDAGYAYTAIRSSASAGQFTPAEVLATLDQRKEDGSTTSAVLGPFTEVGIGLALDDDGVPTWVLLLASKEPPEP